MKEKKILLHICCAPCATASAERLLQENRKVVLFFSNSNIWPEEEYNKRLESAEFLAEKMNLSLETDRYDHNKWLTHVKGMENEPEKGARCSFCFDFSLEKAALKAESLGIRKFTTSLSVSPHKASPIIFRAGSHYSGFAPYDFKKKDGFKRSIELSEEYGLYRQNYCGCEFSKRN
jgi:predicted adenine nucleotide alpha hydrolase (AANH) superfamily ATPase